MSRLVRFRARVVQVGREISKTSSALRYRIQLRPGLKNAYRPVDVSLFGYMRARIGVRLTGNFSLVIRVSNVTTRQ